MSHQTLNLTPALYDYLLKVSLREHPVLHKLRAKTSGMTGAAMQISPEQGQLMQLLIELIRAKKTLDIGTYTGYSALAVALALPEDGKVMTCDISPDSTNVAREFWREAKMDHKIELHLAPALTTLQQLLASGEAESFDFVFIDADKHNYNAYYELSLTLLRPGGLVAVDNALWDGAVADLLNNDNATIAIRRLNEKIHQDDRVSISLLPVGDGLMLARKR